MIKYPLYVFDKDDNSIIKIKEAFQLAYFEEFAVDSGLLEGWDSNGDHFKFFWDHDSQSPLVIIDKKNDKIGFRTAIAIYIDALKEFNVEITVDYINSNTTYPLLCEPSAIESDYKKIFH